VLQYLLIFLAAFAGSVHCVGMCGGFACALGRDTRGTTATMRRHLLYNVGRATTYCFLGAAVGALGVLLVGHHGEGTPASLAQRALALVSGALIVYAGLQFFGFSRGRWQEGPAAQFLTSGLRRILGSPSASAPLALGVLNGFLPCPLVYAFAAQAAASGGPLPGFLTMAALSLGTFPAMFLVGGVGVWLRPRVAAAGAQQVPIGFGGALARSDWRRQVMRMAGGFIVLLGLITLARGLLPMSAHLHG
jgi:sulfite exporter TauE/SafE